MKNLILMLLLSTNTSVFANTLADKVFDLHQHQESLPVVQDSDRKIEKLYSQYIHYFHSDDSEFSTLIVGGLHESLAKRGMNEIENIQTMNIEGELRPHDVNGDIAADDGITNLSEQKYDFVVFEFLPSFIYTPYDEFDDFNKIISIINAKKLLKDNGVLVIIGHTMLVDKVNMALNINTNLQVVPINVVYSEGLNTSLSFYTIEQIGALS